MIKRHGGIDKLVHYPTITEFYAGEAPLELGQEGTISLSRGLALPAQRPGLLFTFTERAILDVLDYKEDKC